jgi:hypothetical protein
MNRYLLEGGSVPQRALSFAKSARGSNHFFAFASLAIT